MPRKLTQPQQGKKGGARRRASLPLGIALALALLLGVFPPTRRAANWSGADARYAYALDRYLFGYTPRYQWVTKVGQCESRNVITTVSIAPQGPARSTEHCWVVDWQWAGFQAALALALLCVGMWRRKIR